MRSSAISKWIVRAKLTHPTQYDYTCSLLIHNKPSQYQSNPNILPLLLLPFRPRQIILLLKPSEINPKINSQYFITIFIDVQP